MKTIFAIIFILLVSQVEAQTTIAFSMCVQNIKNIEASAGWGSEEYRSNLDQLKDNIMAVRYNDPNSAERNLLEGVIFLTEGYSRNAFFHFEEAFDLIQKNEVKLIVSESEFMTLFSSQLKKLHKKHQIDFFGTDRKKLDVMIVQIKGERD